MQIDRTQIELTAEQREWLARQAETSGKPWPDLLAELVPSQSNGDAQAGATESAYDMANRLGLIGTSDDGPDDLATNPRHMNGFGEIDHVSDSD